MHGQEASLFWSLLPFSVALTIPPIITTSIVIIVSVSVPTSFFLAIPVPFSASAAAPLPFMRVPIQLPAPAILLVASFSSFVFASLPAISLCHAYQRIQYQELN